MVITFFNVRSWRKLPNFNHTMPDCMEPKISNIANGIGCPTRCSPVHRHSCVIIVGKEEETYLMRVHVDNRIGRPQGSSLTFTEISWGGVTLGLLLTGRQVSNPLQSPCPDISFRSRRTGAGVPGPWGHWLALQNVALDSLPSPATVCMRHHKRIF